MKTMRAQEWAEIAARVHGKKDAHRIARECQVASLTGSAITFNSELESKTGGADKARRVSKTQRFWDEAVRLLGVSK